jgi:pimeloyl-ACP methyl ester carboxylesterase
MPKAEANGIEIEYDSFGSKDSEPIFLISGLGVQMIRWTVPFCETLMARGFRVIRFDNRDVGLSTYFDDAPIPDLGAVARAIKLGEQPDVPYTLCDMAKDVVGLMDALEIQRAHIVGRSMGGMIAQVVVSEYPHRVLSLTSIMSSTGNPNLPPTSAEVMAVLMRHPPHPSEDKEGYLSHSVSLSRVIGSPGYPFDEAAQRTQALAEAKRGYYPAGFGRQIAATIAVGDLRARLKTITAPTLVVHGDADPLVSVAGGEDTAANINGAKLQVIQGMGHDLPPELYETISIAIADNARRAHQMQ